MGWFGKVVGGTVGFLFGGPLGMVAGIAFGHLFDKAESPHQSDENQDPYRWWEQQQEQYQQQYRQQQQQDYQYQKPVDTSFKLFEERNIPHEKLKITQKQLMFFTGTFSMLYCVASADGAITKEELVAVERDIITNRLQFTPQEGMVAMKFFRAAQENSSTISEYATQFGEAFSASPALLQLMIDFLYQLRAVDGDASGKKNEMILQVASIFHVSQDVVSAIKRKNSNEATRIDHLFATLYLSPEASYDETKRAYRRLCAEFHPDTLASQGLGAEFKKMAEAQFNDINEAFSTIKTMKGWN